MYKYVDNKLTHKGTEDYAKINVELRASWTCYVVTFPQGDAPWGTIWEVNKYNAVTSAAF